MIDARERANAAYERRRFDAAQGKRNRDVQRDRTKAIREQTAEIRLLRKTLENLLLDPKETQ